MDGEQVLKAQIQLNINLIKSIDDLQLVISKANINSKFFTNPHTLILLQNVRSSQSYLHK